MPPNERELLERVDELREDVNAAYREVQRVIVGMEEMVDSVFITLIAGGHVRVVGTPGLAKTKLMRAVARVSGLSFGRIQGNAGLTPDDIKGPYLKGEDNEENRKRGGLAHFQTALFNNFVLWDEAARTNPKAQEGVLSPMEEYIVVTAYGEIISVPNPFVVALTDNPREISRGVNPLTDANLDRISLQTVVEFPKFEELERIAKQDDSEPHVEELDVKLSGEKVRELRRIVIELLPVDRYPRMLNFACRLIYATRPERRHDHPDREILAKNLFPMPDGSPVPLEEVIALGVSPRAEKHLQRAARADAFIRGTELSAENVKRVAHRVLRHRIQLHPEAESVGITADDVVDFLLKIVPEVREKYTHA